MEPRVTFSEHAIIRMFERDIRADEVVEVAKNGDVVESYDDDTPYPSRLISGSPSGRPIHVVVADNEAEKELIVVTVYEPDPAKWESGFMRRMT